jgi:hypothetical protein
MNLLFGLNLAMLMHF